MKNAWNVFDTMLNSLGIYIGIQDIESWLGVALLVVSLCSMLARAGITAYRHFKKGNIEKALDEVDDAMKKAHDIIEKENDKHGK